MSFAATIPSKDLPESQHWNSSSTTLRFLQVSAAPWIPLTKGSSLFKCEWEDLHEAVTQPTALLLQGAPQMDLLSERAGGGVLWLEGVLLPRHLSLLSSPDTKILHSEGFLHLLRPVWSKEHYRKKYLKGREINGQREGRETNLIWMIA